MSEAKRRDELFRKSKRQLLIGLLETTTGLGFEKIIQNDFERIGSDTDRIFFVMLCLCTQNKATASAALLSRALTALSITESPSAIASRLPGMIEYRDRSWVARHPVYARRIIESIIEPDLLLRSIRALLDTFSVYPHPVVTSLNKSEAAIFKALINHRFLRSVLRDHWSNIMGVYAEYEKVFENDGLFWLQYGLAARSMGDQTRAYGLLATAYEAYPHDHTAHALAQQELILAALDTTPTAVAENYVENAIERLTALDKTLKSHDTYPLVTLSEGHVKALRRIRGDNAARIQARTYTELLDRRLRSTSDDRVRAAYETLFRYSSTGNWSDGDSDGLDFD